MAIVPFHIVDAFADYSFTGNPAAIIPNATGLSELEMRGITDELSMEAGFILPPSTVGADIRLRFFTQRREAALSGHVAIAAFASMADRGFYRVPPGGMDLKVETGAGLLPVHLGRREDGRVLVTLELPPARFGEPVSAGELSAALDVPAEHLMYRGFGPQRVSCGFDQIVVPVCEREVIRGEFKDSESIGRLTDLRGVGGITLFCPYTYSDEADFHLRFFHPRLGAQEDVASGTSMGAAAAFLVHNKLVPVGDETLIITEQGHSLGRPTRTLLQVNSLGNRVAHVRLSATGVVVMRGSFHFHHGARRAEG